MDIRGDMKGVAGDLSNFRAYAFLFDGVECGCMEALLQAFKFENPETQVLICQFKGRVAKMIGTERNPVWQSAQTLWWKGKEYPRSSAAYQELLDRAFAALSQNTDFVRALLATGNEVLRHSIGEADPAKTVLTEEEFCSRLMKIRERLNEKLVLSIEEMNEAARLVEIDGIEAYATVSKVYGEETAMLLIVAHLRRAHGSMDGFPPDPPVKEIVDTVRSLQF
ncbi:hypothetical protein HGA34_04135 [Candidatus Falkowbacteria bacterium]|nr:hypothetical protein [Candidatus Falkowbacteria bacterium]